MKNAVACLLMLVGLAGSPAAQTAQEHLQAALSQARQRSGSLPPSRRVLAARLEILEHQFTLVQHGKQDWSGFFHYFEETRQQITGSLPAALQPHWDDICRYTEALASAQGFPLQNQTEDAQGSYQALADALHRLEELEAQLGPATEDQQAEARRHLRELGAQLRRGVAEQKQGKAISDGAGLVRARRRFFFSRQALGLPDEAFSRLDEALLRLPQKP